MQVIDHYLYAMLAKCLPEQPVIRATLIFLVAFGVYAAVVKVLGGGSGMGFGGGAVVGALLAFLDHKRRKDPKTTR